MCKRAVDYCEDVVLDVVEGAKAHVVLGNREEEQSRVPTVQAWSS